MIKLQENQRQSTILLVSTLFISIILAGISVFFIDRLDTSKSSSVVLAIVGFLFLFIVVGFSLFQPRIAFSILLILFSLFVQLRYYFSFNVVSYLWIMPVNLILILLLIGSIPYLRSITIYREDALLISFVIVSGLPIMWARDIDLAILGYEQAILEPFIVYFLVRVFFSSKKGLKLLLLIFGLSMTATIMYLGFEAIRSGGLVNIIRAQTIRDYKVIDTVFRAGYGEPIAIATIFMYVWPVLFFMYKVNWQSKWIPRMFQILRWVMPLIVVITVSRRHIIILLLVTATLIFWSYKYRMLSWKVVFLLLIGGSVTLTLFLPNYVQRFTVGKGIITDPRILGGRPVEFSTARYIAEHIAAVKALKANPQGIGGFNGDYYWKLYNPVPTNFGWKHLRQLSIFIPYSEIGIHYGWLALVLFVVYFIRLLRITWRFATRSNGIYMYLGAGLFTSFLWTGLLDSMGVNVSFTGNFEHLPVNAFAIWSFILFALVPILHYIQKEQALMQITDI